MITATAQAGKLRCDYLQNAYVVITWQIYISAWEKFLFVI